MPHQQRSPRRVRNHLITYGDVVRANTTVTAELARLGFWHTRLEDVDVWWVPSSLVYYGWYRQHIYIPALTGAQLSDLILGRRTRLTDVMRHEWAHAVADRWPRLIYTRKFEAVFGGSYGCLSMVRKYHASHHLTKYSATMPSEDFAEVFHYYLRHKGRLPQRLAYKPAIVAKWKYIHWLSRRISGRKVVKAS
jgi:hypothetical protein